MPEYRRLQVPGATYFFTVVTFRRRPILTTEVGLASLRQAWRLVRSRQAFRTLAVCVLPEHLHAIWVLPEGDSDYSNRWGAIKSVFSKHFLAAGGWQAPSTRSRRERGEASVWQRRFWEHWIRDEEDLRRHVDYIHYNPVKHGLVRRPEAWPWSTFRRYAAQGWYEAGWGAREPDCLQDLATARE